MNDWIGEGDERVVQNLFPFLIVVIKLHKPTKQLEYSSPFQGLRLVTWHSRVKHTCISILIIIA